MSRFVVRVFAQGVADIVKSADTGHQGKPNRGLDDVPEREVVGEVDDNERHEEVQGEYRRYPPPEVDEELLQDVQPTAELALLLLAPGAFLDGFGGNKGKSRHGHCPQPMLAVDVLFKHQQGGEHRHVYAEDYLTCEYA